ncbi:MAG: branched-chain amino acid transport system ATP-binding protein [Acidimicrobiaceae bacterium]
MSLRVEAITAGYGANVVLRDIDLIVPRGKVVALLGANGAGKTTLLRVCSGLLAPRRGRVLLDDVDVTHASPHQLAASGLCHIPEGRAVFPSLTVAQNLRLMAKPGDTDVADKATQAFPALGRKLQQRAGTMSGGEQQMLALARAYLIEPSYVLLDEVSMGLAPIVVDTIFEFLGNLAGRGVALLIVEQYVTKALALADLCFVMQNGRLAFAGEPSEIDADAIARSYLGADAAPARQLSTPGGRPS